MDTENIEKSLTTEKTIREFMQSYRTIQVEIQELKERAKELVEEYEDKLDTKTLKKAMRVAKILQKVESQDIFDEYSVVLETEIVV